MQGQPLDTQILNAFSSGLAMNVDEVSTKVNNIRIVVTRRVQALAKEGLLTAIPNTDPIKFVRKGADLASAHDPIPAAVITQEPSVVLASVPYSPPLPETKPASVASVQVTADTSQEENSVPNLKVVSSALTQPSENQILFALSILAAGGCSKVDLMADMNLRNEIYRDESSSDDTLRFIVDRGFAMVDNIIGATVYSITPKAFNSFPILEDSDALNLLFNPHSDENQNQIVESESQNDISSENLGDLQSQTIDSPALAVPAALEKVSDQENPLPELPSANLSEEVLAQINNLFVSAVQDIRNSMEIEYGNSKVNKDALIAMKDDARSIAKGLKVALDGVNSLLANLEKMS